MNIRQTVIENSVFSAATTIEENQGKMLPIDFFAWGKPNLTIAEITEIKEFTGSLNNLIRMVSHLEKDIADAESRTV